MRKVIGYIQGLLYCLSKAIYSTSVNPHKKSTDSWIDRAIQEQAESLSTCTPSISTSPCTTRPSRRCMVPCTWRVPNRRCKSHQLQWLVTEHLVYRGRDPETTIRLRDPAPQTTLMDGISNSTTNSTRLTQIDTWLFRNSRTHRLRLISDWYSMLQWVNAKQENFITRPSTTD